MADTENEKDKEGLESILKSTNDPKRGIKESTKEAKKAKFTRETFASLKKKISENRLSRAYEKYNKKYAKLVGAAVNVSTMLEEKKAGKKVSNTTIHDEYDRAVNKYNTKLAKHGTKLISLDIKKAVKEYEAPEKDPRRLFGKIKISPKFMRQLGRCVRTFQLRRDVKKEINNATKENIADTLNSAFLKGKNNNVVGVNEELIAKMDLGTHINEKGKLSFNTATREDPDFLNELRNLAVDSSGRKIDMAPTPPTSSVEKESTRTANFDLTGELEKQNNSAKQETNEPKQNEPKKPIFDLSSELQKQKQEESKQNEPKKPIFDLDSELKKQTQEQPKTAETKTAENVTSTVDNGRDFSQIAKRQREVDLVLSLSDSIDKLKDQISKSSYNPELRSRIQKYINDTENLIDEFISKPTIEKTTEVKPTNETEEIKPAQVDTPELAETSSSMVREEKSMEPISVDVPSSIDSIINDEIISKPTIEKTTEVKTTNEIEEIKPAQIDTPELAETSSSMVREEKSMEPISVDVPSSIDSVVNDDTSKKKAVVYADGEIASVDEDEFKSIKENSEKIRQNNHGTWKKDGYSIVSNDEINVTDEQPNRADQVSAPSTLSITRQDIINMEARKNKAQSELTRLQKERTQLEEQRNLYQQYIELAKPTIEAEDQIKNLTQENAAVAKEVADLETEAASLTGIRR